MKRKQRFIKLSAKRKRVDSVDSFCAFSIIEIIDQNEKSQNKKPLVIERFGLIG